MDGKLENEWGNTKTEYYSKNKRDKEDSDFAEEEVEAIRIQQKKLQKLREAKLIDSDNEDESSAAKPKTIVKKGKKFNIESSEDEAVEKKKAKPSTEDKEENQQILTNLKINLEEAYENLEPIIDIFGSRPSLAKMTNYLSSKKDMHSLYSVYLLYFLYFKLKGNIPDHHPVVKKMLYIKSLLNNMKEIDEQSAKKIDVILKLIEQQGGNNEESEEVEEPKLLNKKREKQSILDLDLNDYMNQNDGKLNNLREQKAKQDVKVL
jgi:U3 small nucleolar RNA-associated protein 3